MKQKVLIDMKVVCELPHNLGRGTITPEYWANRLKECCREFEAFVRDHRSQDQISVSVEREYEEQCSHCGYKWETDEEGCPMCCDKAQKEWEEKKSCTEAT